MNDSILTKIEALFRLGEHATANPQEAANALACAQALLLEHNLTRACINTNGEAPTTQAIGKVEIKNTTGHNWKVRLLETIARANLCMVIDDPANKKAHVFGTETNVLAVVQMFDWLARELEFQAIRDWKAYKADGGTVASRTWRASFNHGAINALHRRLAKPKEEFAAGAGSAIVLANDTRVKAAVDRVFPNLAAGRRRTHSVNRDGFNSGRQAGGSVTLGPQGAIAGGMRVLGSGH